MRYLSVCVCLLLSFGICVSSVCAHNTQCSLGANLDPDRSHIASAKLTFCLLICTGMRKYLETREMFVIISYHIVSESANLLYIFLSFPLINLPN